MEEDLSLEQYLSSIDNLPAELHQNFSMMCKFDSHKQELVRDIDTQTQNLFSNFEGMSLQEREEAINKIHDSFDKTDKCSDDKMQLSTKSYEIVDKHIRRLDADLAKYEAALQYKATKRQFGFVPSKDGTKAYSQKDKMRRGSAASDRDDDSASKHGDGKKKNKKESNSQTGKKSGIRFTMDDFIASNTLGYAASTSSSAMPDVDMPVDPNEPTYCLCNQVSYGEMIGCDNPQCAIEWFHFGCVNLTTKPKGKWYCPQCRLYMKKK